MCIFVCVFICVCIIRALFLVNLSSTYIFHRSYFLDIYFACQSKKLSSLSIFFLQIKKKSRFIDISITSKLIRSNFEEKSMQSTIYQKKKKTIQFVLSYKMKWNGISKDDAIWLNSKNQINFVWPRNQFTFLNERTLFLWTWSLNNHM